MIPCRNCYANGVNTSFGEIAEIIDSLRVEFDRDLRRAFFVFVEDSGEFHAFHVTPDAGVILAEAAYACYRYANLLSRHDFFFASVFSTANASIAIPASSAARIR